MAVKTLIISSSRLKFLSFWHAGINFAIRKIVSMLKPQKVITQDGDRFTIRTLTTFRSYEISFKIGEEFKEVSLDNKSFQVKLQYTLFVFLWSLPHNLKQTEAFFIQSCTPLLVPCQTVVNWENDKLVCVQKGEKKNRGWTHWIEGDELHLVWELLLFWRLLIFQFSDGMWLRTFTHYST